MSVMMGMRMSVDPDTFERYAQANAERMEAISRRGKEMGAIHHMFLAGDDEVMVADEWESEAAFHAFFEAAGAEIGALMQEVGVTNQPEPRFWKPLATADRF
jgi:heme-degrading monooxygenase HmoA